MHNVDLTYGDKLRVYITDDEKNFLESKKIDVNYTYESETKQITTTSFLISEKPFLMITFNYQELKELLESKGE